MKLKQGGIEVISLETRDGMKLPLKGAWLDFGFSNFGAAAIEWQSQTGYKRNGSRIIDYRLLERRFNVLLGGSEVNNQRYEYWNQRAELLNILRPNRGTGHNELTLTISRLDENGNPIKRAINCVYESGAEFEDFDEDSNQFRVTAGLQFIANNPLWFNPASISLELVASTSEDLVFPITFPIIFGASGSVFATGALDYEGTWRAYPTITLEGPYESAQLVDNGTGATITMGVPISAGGSRIIRLSENGFEIVDNLGNSAFSELSSDSNLIDFYIPTVGQVISGGSQSITVTLVGGDGSSGVTIDYDEMYYGI